MKKTFQWIAFAFCLLFAQQIWAQGGYKIDVTVAGYDQGEVQLAYHFGDKQYVKQTAAASGGSFTFMGNEALPGGIYLISLPPSNVYFELIIDKDQHFKVETDIGELVKNMKISGSEENEAFYEDLNFMSEKRLAVDALNKAKEGLDADSEEARTISEKVSAVDQEVKEWRKKFTERNSGLFYTKILRAMQEPEIPQAPKDENGKEPEDFAYWYYRNHYFDKIDLTDDRLLRTPIIQSKLDQFLDKLVPQQADSLNAAIDEIIDKTRPNKEVFRFFVVTILNKYANSKMMGMDAVYVHMVEKYFVTKEAWWADEETIRKMTERALALSPILLGKTAPNFSAQDMDGEWQDLASIKAKYTLLYFWDYDCGYCKEITPKLAEAYKLFADKDIALMTVSIYGDMKVWKKRIGEYGLENAINVHGQPRESFFVYERMYDLRSTPRLFVLDEDKKIIAKQITVSQMVEALSRELGIEVDYDGDEAQKD